MPDTEALTSLPSQIITQENENNTNYSTRLDPADTANRAARRVGTATPELEDSQKIILGKAKAEMHFESNDTSQVGTRNVSDLNINSDDGVRIASQTYNHDSSSLEGNRNNSALIVEENVRVSDSRETGYQLRQCSTNTMVAPDISGKIDKDSLELVHEEPVIQPSGMSPAQQNYARLKTPPSEKVSQQKLASSNMLANYCAS